MRRGTPGPALTDLGLVGLAVTVGAAAVLRGAGSLAAGLAGTAPPPGGLMAGIRVLGRAGDPGAALGSPGLNPVVYWTVVAAVLLVPAMAIAVVWRLALRTRARRRRYPRRIVGTAVRADVVTLASDRALVRRARTLRPSLARPTAADVGYLLGRCHGEQVWASVEDSILVLGPPRSGKGMHVVINAILDAPGAVVTTSTRPDNLAATITARRRRGPVAVFDPQHTASGVHGTLRWSPLRGCEDPLTAMIRATGFAAATGLSAGGVESGGFWEGKTRVALQALLHAGALGDRPAMDLFTWSVEASRAADAVAILRSDPRAAPGWAESLDAVIHGDPRSRESVWMGVAQALACLADPRVLEAVTPGPGEDFDPVAFLTGNGTLYLLATGAGARTAWPLVAAFVEDLVETARHLAAAAPAARLDPPLLLALDEIGNLAPLPSLPVLMAEGGGTGITTMPVLQSMSQARSRWGASAAGTIWDAAIVKVVLGGASDASDLRDLSALIGERDETTDTTSVGPDGARTVQRSLRRVPVMPPDVLRTLPYGTGTILLRSAPALVARLRPWTDRPDGGQLATERAAIERLLGHRTGPEPPPTG